MVVHEFLAALALARGAVEPPPEFVLVLPAERQTASGAGNATSGLAVEQRSSGAEVVVVVSYDGQVLVQRIYGEAFFKSG